MFYDQVYTLLYEPASVAKFRHNCMYCDTYPYYHQQMESILLNYE